MALDFGKLMMLSSKLDPETAKLLGRFVVEALQAPNTNDFVKRALRAALVAAGVRLDGQP